MSKSKAKPAATATAEPAGEPRPLQSVGDALTDPLTSHLKAKLGIADPPQEQPKVDEVGPEPVPAPAVAAAEPAAPDPDPAPQEPDPEAPADPAASDDATPAEPAETTTDVSALYQDAADPTAANEESSADDADLSEERVPLKRLHKEVSRRKALEARLAELEARSTPAAPAPDPTAPFLEQLPEVAAAKKSEAEMSNALANARALARQAQQNPDAARATLQSKHGYDASNIGDLELVQQLEDTLDTLRQQHTEAVTRRVATTERARMQLDAYRQQQDAAAVQKYPWQANPKSPEYAAAQQLLREFPGLVQHPQRGFILGRQVAGLMAERAALAQAAPAAPRQHPPKIPAPKTVPRSATTTSRPADALAAARKAAASGDQTAMAEALTGII